MKIAIVTYAFYESTFPFFKELSKKHNVDLYCIVNRKVLTLPSFSITLNNKYRNNSLISNSVLSEDIRNYIGANLIENINIYLWESSIIDLFFVRNNLGGILKKKKYEVIHFVNSSFLYQNISKINFKTSKIVFSIHESVLNRANSGPLSFMKILKKIRNRNSSKCLDFANSLIFHSENEKNKFLENRNNISCKIEVLKFSLFETYLTLSNKNNKALISKPYFLYIGYIKKYKGVDFLIDTILNNKELSKINFVIAGKDDIGLEKKCLTSNINIINKFLTDNEFVDLVSNAKAVILPYRSSSQSGIPSAAFCFNVPIVFSNVIGLKEYIKNEYNGIEFNANQEDSLKQSILKMDQIKYRNKLRENIAINPFGNEYQNWRNFSLSMVNIYKSI
jgi:glycosyltransferase involved in cell wall biosynthesis